MSKRRADGDPEGVPEPKRAAAPAVSVFSLLEAEHAGVGADLMVRCMQHWLVESNDLHQARAALCLRAVSTSWQRAWNVVFHRNVIPAYQRRSATFVEQIREWMVNGCDGESRIFLLGYANVSALQILSYLLLCVNADPYTPAFLRTMRAKTIRQIVAPLKDKTADDPRLSNSTWEDALRIVHGDVVSLELLQHCSYLALPWGVEDLLQKKIVPWYKYKIYRDRAKFDAFMAK